MTPQEILQSARIAAESSKGSPRIVAGMLKTCADLAQARMIAIFESSQKDLINVLASVSNKDLMTNNIGRHMKRVRVILDNMRTISASNAETLVTANLLGGKLMARASVGSINVKNTKDIFDLTSSDKSRIDSIVNKMVGNINHAASSSEQSILSQLNAACIKAQTTKSMAKDVVIEASIPNINSSADVQMQTARVSIGPTLTEAQIKEIKRAPGKALKEINSDAARQVSAMRGAYILSRKEADKIRQKALASNRTSNQTGTINAQGELISSLMQNGISAFVDKSGRRWNLSSYCNMATRSLSKQSANCGEIFEDEAHDLYIVVDMRSSCPICSKYEGKVFSRSGTNPNYPPLSSIFGKIDKNGPDDLTNSYLSIHPNCRHTIKKWYERGKTAEEIQEIREKSNSQRPAEGQEYTEEQIRAYKEHERIMSIEAASERKYRELAQFIPFSELGNWLTFNKHFIAKDEVYHSLLSKYRQKVNSMNKKA